MDVLQMSFAAAVLVIAVIILRALTLYKLPKRTFLILWGVVLCRLLIPFSIPFHLSFYTGIDMLLKQTPVQPTPVVTSFIPAAIPASVTGVGGEPAVGGSSSMPVTPLLLIWLAGLCLFIFFFTVSYIRWRRVFKTALPVENDIVTAWRQVHPMRRSVQIRQSDRLDAPLTYGVFRPVVLVPKTTDWKDGEKLQYILAHEYVHIRRFDALLKLLFTVVLCVHWFNPFVWVMFLLANRDIELSCDEAVVKKYNGSAKSDYALALIGLEEKKSRLIPLCNNFNKNAINERITAIMKSRKFTAPVIIAAVVIILIITLVFATSKAVPASDTASDTAALEDIISEQQAILKKEIELRQLLLEEAAAADATADNTVNTPEASPAPQFISEKDWVWPCPDCTTVTSLYGIRFHPVRKEYILSDHINIGAKEGAAVNAALDGTVGEADFDSEQGNYILINHDNGIQTVYRHLGNLRVSAGDAVAAGDTIGMVGSTGIAASPGLAFGVWYNEHSVNPLKYYKEMFPKLGLEQEP